MPERDGPIRNWASVINSSSQPAGASSEDKKESGMDENDPVFRGVLSGGRVVDEWIRQAQQAARLLGGDGRSTAGWADTSSKIFKATSDLAAAWWSVLGAIPPNTGMGSSSTPPGHQSAWQAGATADASSASHRPPSASGTAPTSESAAGPRIRLEIASRRPVEVTVDIHRRGVNTLRVLDLRPERGDAPRLSGTELEAWGSDGCCLRLTVPDEQPSGVYHAVVLDADADCAIGTVTLRIPS
jgi:hypothetical protein